MPTELSFLPAPRRAAYPQGSFTLTDDRLIVLDAPVPQELVSAGWRLKAALQKHAGLTWNLNASAAAPEALVGVALRVAPEREPHAQGYRLHITPQGVEIEGHDPAGVFYGVCTFIQLLQQVGRELPLLEVQDWPDISARGVMLDISRDRVYSMDTLYELVDRLAGWKINQLQLYTEHTFAYQDHKQVWQKASPMTGEEILALDAFCRELFIELVPNQNSFGHLHRWLTLERYAGMAETHGEIIMPWGVMHGPFSLAPEHPASLPFIKSLYDELLPHFTSRMFNVGFDETFDLGQGQTKELVEQRGEGPVYLDFLLKVYADVKRRGYTMQFWGDIILKHPDLVPLLPRDVIALSWGYEADHPFDQEGAAFAASGVPFYVCPGTSSWNTLAGRTENAVQNLLNAAENGLKYGAVGYLNTDWGDNGHWQVPPASYLGFAAGAALSWGVDANRDDDWAGLVSRYAFEDPTGAAGRVAYDLGSVYDRLGFIIPNSSALFWILYLPMTQIAGMAERYGMDTVGIPDGLRAGLSAIDEAMQPLEQAQIQRPDAELIKREYRHTARLMRHACRRGILAFGADDPAERAALAEDMHAILVEYRALWLARSRPGGLDNSAACFEQIIQEYQS